MPCRHAAGTQQTANGVHEAPAKPPVKNKQTAKDEIEHEDDGNMRPLKGGFVLLILPYQVPDHQQYGAMAADHSADCAIPPP